jgi:hypothetical protein
LNITNNDHQHDGPEDHLAASVLSDEPIQGDDLISEGIHRAVIADVVDLGLMETEYGCEPGDDGPCGKEVRGWVEFVFFTEETDRAGKQKRISKRFIKAISPARR